jgi:hypothetical protein
MTKISNDVVYINDTISDLDFLIGTGNTLAKKTKTFY